jgi:Zn-dependent peptidase ImmA (M78 family)
MLACRTNALWGELPHQSLLTELFDAARRGFDERMVAERVFEAPVPARAKQLAVAFALYRRLRPDVSARLPTVLVSEAVAGEPSAAEAIAAKLAEDADWLRCVSQVQRDVVSEEDAAARAQLTDFTRFARTLYSLEVSADQRDRRISWTSFCRVTAGADSFLDTVPWRAGERLADEVRHRLGYDGERIDGFRRFAEEQAGVFVGSMDQLDGYDCAAAVPRNTPPCMFVQRRNTATNDEMLRVRFALAHELGHLLSDRHDTGRWVCSTLGHDRADTEKRANAFAAYFLAPRHAVRALVPSLPEIDSTEFYVAVQRVREEFGLSSIAAGEHLRNCHNDHALGRLPDAVRNKLASMLANEPTRIHEGGDVESENESASSLRKGRYRRLVEMLRRAGVLDDNRAAALIEPATS